MVAGMPAACAGTAGTATGCPEGGKGSSGSCAQALSAATAARANERARFVIGAGPLEYGANQPETTCADGWYLTGKFTELLPFLHPARAALRGWLDAPLGRALVAAESELLVEALDDVFGWELLQVGDWGGTRALLAGGRTRRQAIVSSDPADGRADLIARLAQLPLANDSIDAALLPHTLEFEADPYALIREVDRVLAGEGQLLVLGFRPLSLWGLRSRAARRGFPPGMKRLLPERRLRDWLVLLGYEVVLSRHYLYCTPWGAPGAPGNGAHMLRRGLLNPLPAGAYLLKARKRLYTLTPLRMRLRERKQVLGGLVEPTTRS